MIGEITDLSLDFKTRKTKVTLLVEAEPDQIEELQGQKLTVELKKYRAKRSLNSNNYAWKIITEIANILRSSKEEVYIEMLKRYGQSQMISVFAEINVSKFLRYYEEAGESQLNGRLFKHYKVYTGSSEMDTKEMSILIDGIVAEAKELGIETMTPNELQSLKESWKQ
jgi:hypothetical protein